MKIRLGILDKDEQYAARLTAYFKSYNAEQVDVFRFSSQDSLNEFFKKNKVDVLLADDDLVGQDFKLPKNIGFAYLSDSKDIDKIRGTRTVCRYQRADLILKEVVNIYSELDSQTVFRSNRNDFEMIVFRGASGGVGTTTCAAACAKSLALAGNKVLFLELQENGVIAPLLSGEGNGTLSDALYAIKSKSPNLPMKLESIVRQDPSNVDFFEPFSITIDATEMTKDNMTSLFDAVAAMGKYRFVIADIDSVTNECTGYLMNKAVQIFLVSDGTEISNKKLDRAVKAMAVSDDKSDNRMLPHTKIIYNKFGSGAKAAGNSAGLDVLCKIARYAGGTEQAVLSEIVKTGVFS